MRRTARGFTLLELMVSLVVLALGLIGVLEAVSKGLVASRDMEDYQLAVSLARLQATEILLLPELTYGYEQGDFAEAYPDFRWESEIDSLGDSSDSDLASVVVSVVWQRGATEHRFRLRTLWSESLRDTLLGNAEVDFVGGGEGTATEGGAGAGMQGGAAMTGAGGFPAGGGIPGGGGGP